MPKFTVSNHEILTAALIGLKKQLAEVDGKIAGLRGRIGRRVRGKAAGARPASRRARRPLSASARRRIAAAQKKRWAAYRKAHR